MPSLIRTPQNQNIHQLRRTYEGSFQNLAEKIYHSWSSGELSVKRTWGGVLEDAETIGYENSACLLPEDVLILKEPEKGVSSKKLVTWNVNSIRSRMNVLLQWLEKHQPEVLCLQETKVEDQLFPCLLYTSPSPRDAHESRMPSSA